MTGSAYASRQPAGRAILTASIAWLLGVLIGLAARSQEILKFDVDPADQKVFADFTPVGPDSKYTPEARFG